MDRLQPYLGSLKAPETFSEQWDAGRRFSFRGTGHLMLFFSGFALATGYYKTVLTCMIVISLAVILRGYMTARSSAEWVESDDDVELSARQRLILWVSPLALVGCVAMFGVGLALFLADDSYFVAGLLGMVGGAAAFIILLRSSSA